MSYCALSDLLNQISQPVLIGLTDDDNIQINQDIINSAITSAEAEVNAYAEAQYDIPFDPVPDVICKLTVDITIYNLFSRRGLDKEKTSDQVIIERYKNAVRFLENLAKKLVTIGKPDPAPPIGAEIKSDHRIFKRHSMWSW